VPRLHRPKTITGKLLLCVAHSSTLSMHVLHWALSWVDSPDWPVMFMEH